MNPQRPSRTAEGAALLRALHAYVDAPPILFSDGAVESLLSAPSRLALRPLPLGLRMALRRRERRQPAGAAMRGQIVLRARFAEDALDDALRRGVEQVVILAAGLDTTALRRGDVLRHARLFEVDHPATQAWKKRRVGARAEGVRYVPVDFGEDDLASALSDAGLDAERPMFVNWLGCTYYLPLPAIASTLARLRTIAAPGSEIVLDHWSGGATNGLPSRLLLSGVRAAVAFQQEPMVGLLGPDELCELAEAAGWDVSEALDAPAQRARWLGQRRDALRVPDFAHLARLVPAP